MTTQEIAHAFTVDCAAGDYDKAQRCWSDDVVSIEAFPSPMQTCRGRDAVRAKQQAWGQMMTVHASKCEGPFVQGDQFAIRFEMDCTGPDGIRQTMREMALYSVSGGKITEERFLPLTSA